MIHSFIRAYRKRYGFSQEELARLLGISRRDLYRFEERGKTPSLAFALKLEIVFGVPPAILFPDLFSKVEEEAMREGKTLLEALEGKTDAISVGKRNLIEEMPTRRVAERSA